MAISKITLNGATNMDVTGTTATASDVLASKTFILADGTTATGSIQTKTSTDLSASGATVSVPAGYYASNASKSVSSGTAGTPSASKGTVNNHAITVTPTVTNTAGYIGGGTINGTGVSVSAAELVSGTYTFTGSGTQNVTNYANATVSAGTAGTPTATKGTVNNHSVSVTPSVTNTGGYISGGTKTGTAVTVSASELVSGSETKTANGTYDVTNLAELVVNVSGGGSVSFDTKTATASNYPTSLSFTSMKGQPKAFVLRLNAQVSSSGSTSYYYIVDIAAFGTTTHGNCFRIGSTRRVDNITSGYSWRYSGTTLTVTSSASSRSASPGAFYSGSYELLYCY